MYNNTDTSGTGDQYFREEDTVLFYIQCHLLKHQSFLQRSLTSTELAEACLFPGSEQDATQGATLLLGHQSWQRLKHRVPSLKWDPAFLHSTGGTRTAKASVSNSRAFLVDLNKYYPSTVSPETFIYLELTLIEFEDKDFKDYEEKKKKAGK